MGNKESNMRNSNKLVIGCGKKIIEDFVNVDIIKLDGIDIVHDLNRFPYPFKDNEFKFIYCDNVLEHLNDIKLPIEELWRISRAGAKIKIIVPIFPSVWSFCDPTHRSIYTYFTFNYFRPEDGLNYYSHARFNIKKRKIVFQKFFKPLEIIINSFDISKKIWAHYFSHIFPAQFLDIELEVVK